MKLALIPPPKEAGYMYETDYQLLLPSFQAVPEYAQTIKKCRARGDFMMLDNGAAEGKTLDRGDLYALARLWQVDEVVVPDVLGDAEATWNNARSWTYDSEFRHMAVLTGKTRDELVGLVARYSTLDYIDTIGIPKLLSNYNISRAYMTGLLEDYVLTYGWDIHWLGLNSKYMHEIHQLRNFRNIIRGVDTAHPFNYGLKAFNLERGSNVVVPRSDEYASKDLSGYLYRVNSDRNVHWLIGEVYGNQTPLG